MLGPDGQPRPDLFVADNLHMNEAGYAIWTREIGAALR
jgi:lysophospholipase L1-like esterase